MTRTALAAPDDWEDGGDGAGIGGPAPFVYVYPRSSSCTSKTRLVRREVFTDFQVIWTREPDGSIQQRIMHRRSNRKTELPVGLMLRIWAKAGLVQLRAAGMGDPSWAAKAASEALTGIAVFLAGRKRAVLGAEWRAHLSGETGCGLGASKQCRVAVGFLCAAFRYRLLDVTDLVWRPVDAVLGSRELSNLIVMLPTLIVAVTFIRSAGVYGLVSNLVNVAAVWSAAYGLIRAGRWWRGVKPPKHEPRRKRE